MVHHAVCASYCRLDVSHFSALVNFAQSQCSAGELCFMQLDCYLRKYAEQNIRKLPQ